MVKTLPSEYLAIVGEMVRQEPGGKVSVLGMYADGAIVFGPDQTLPVGIQLGFYFLFLDGVGIFDTRVLITSPSGKEILKSPLAKHEKFPNKTMTLSINIAQTQWTEWGVYNFEVFLDGKSYPRRFELSKSPTPLVFG